MGALGRLEKCGNEKPRCSTQLIAVMEALFGLAPAVALFLRWATGLGPWPTVALFLRWATNSGPGPNPKKKAGKGTLVKVCTITRN